MVVVGGVAKSILDSVQKVSNMHILLDFFLISLATLFALLTFGLLLVFFFVIFLKQTLLYNSHK